MSLFLQKKQLADKLVVKKTFRTFVKICGITRFEDAELAFKLGADFAGIIVGIEESPRSVSPKAAKTITGLCALPVVLLIDRLSETTPDLAAFVKPYALQVVGECKPDDIEKQKKLYQCQLWKTFHIPAHSEIAKNADALITKIKVFKDAGINTAVLDTMVKGKRGGTGIVCDWETARYIINQSTGVNIFLAGGLTPSNIYDALSSVQPFGIDVSSGVESKTGIKDPEKIAELIKNKVQFDKKSQSARRNIS